MIDSAKLAELRKFAEQLKLHKDTTKNAFIFADMFDQCAGTLESLWKENAELKEALSGRTVSCSKCNEAAKENAVLREKLKHYGGWSGLGPRIDKLEAVARAAELLAAHKPAWAEAADLNEALAALKDNPQENQK